MAFPRLLLAAGRNYKRMLPLMRDARVPTALKAGTAALGLLILSPLDVFGDIPVLGVLDDAVLLTLLCTLFVWLGTQIVEKNVTPRRVIGGPPAVR
jgi:uncharacterized membrane protein YkvA (DUF1232 family)